MLIILFLRSSSRTLRISNAGIVPVRIAIISMLRLTTSMPTACIHSIDRSAVDRLVKTSRRVLLLMRCDTRGSTWVSPADVRTEMMLVIGIRPSPRSWVIE